MRRSPILLGCLTLATSLLVAVAEAAALKKRVRLEARLSSRRRARARIEVLEGRLKDEECSNLDRAREEARVLQVHLKKVRMQPGDESAMERRADGGCA